jgi:hypothetical protein
MNGVRVIREGTAAMVEHDCDPAVAVRIDLGALASLLSDGDIVARYEQHVLALGAELVATPQLRWDEAAQRWRPTGRAIRCIVEPSIDEPTVLIDDVELSIGELARLLANHGASICLVFLDD